MREGRALKRVPALIIVLAAASCAVSCGYSFGYARGGPLKGSKTVFIPVMSNWSAEAGAEAVFTDALRGQFALDRSMKVVASDSSGLTVTGVVNSVQSSPVAFLQGGAGATVGEYSISAAVTLEGRLQDGKGLKVTVSDKEPYLLASEPAGTESNRALALSRLAARMMTEGHRRLMEGF
jgi:hypothetical protein